MDVVEKDLIICPLVVSKPNALQRQAKLRDVSVSKGKKSQTTDSEAPKLRKSAKKSVQTKKYTTTKVIASENLVVEDISVSDLSEKLNENHPLMKYKNRKLWSDKEYQISSLKKLIEMMTNNHFYQKDALKTQALKTIKHPTLPSGLNVIPIIKFNAKGEPKFEFYFSAEDSPLDVQEVLQIDNEILILSKTIYECIIHS